MNKVEYVKKLREKFAGLMDKRILPNADDTITVIAEDLCHKNHVFYHKTDFEEVSLEKDISVIRQFIQEAKEKSNQERIKINNEECL